MKLYMIGIDAVPLWLLEELKGKKGMSGFRKLLAKGCITNMNSTLPPLTGPAWPTIYTGLSPAEHGVPDFFEMKSNYTPDIAYYDSHLFPPFWEKLAEKGLRCLVVTPATCIKLTDSKNVDLITGFPLSARTNSPMLEKLMKEHKFTGEPDIEKDIKAGKMPLKEALPIFVRSIRKRIAITKEAMANKEYDFAYVCFTETDRLQHFVLNRKDWQDYLHPIYSEMSGFIEEIMEKCDEEKASLIIVSDHGSQPIHEKFLINTWLVNNGYASLNENIMQKGSEEKSEKSSVKYMIRENLIRNAKFRRIYDRMPHAIKSKAHSALGKVFSGASTGDYTRVHLFDFDMEKTVAFAAISNDPVSTIWINDGRFEKGIVKEKDKAKLKEELMDKLRKIKGRKGEKLIINVFDGRDYYKKTTRFIAPDIMVQAEEGYTIDIFYYSMKSMFMEPETPKSGDHIRNGIFGFYSKTSKPIGINADVLNVAPTILEYFGINRGNKHNSILKKIRH
jgi:predicted AlkP superfamily phosphohydrolase/phosphomutase